MKTGYGSANRDTMERLASLARLRCQVLGTWPPQEVEGGEGIAVDDFNGPIFLLFCDSNGKFSKARFSSLICGHVTRTCIFSVNAELGMCQNHWFLGTENCSLGVGAIH